MKQTVAINQETLDVGMQVKGRVYHDMKTSGVLGAKQKVVLDCLRGCVDGLTDKGIAVSTGLSLSCVCGRRNELMQMGLVGPVSIHTYVDDDGGCISNVVWGVI